MKAGAVETRWIILGVDGRHVTIGRHTDPSLDEIERAEAALAAGGQAGWLAVMKGGYHQQPKPSLLMVRPLCDPQRSWDEAVAAFEAARQSSLSGSA